MLVGRKFSRLRQLSNASRLVSVVVCLSVVGAIWIGATGLQRLRVGGPIYSEIARGKDVIADVLPPPLYIIEAFLLVNLAAKDRIAAQTYFQKFSDLRNQYEQRQAFWRGAPLKADIATALLRESYDPAEKFWGIAEEAFFPALIAGDAAAADNYFQQLHEAYTAHRIAIDRVVSLATTANAATEVAANRENNWIFLSAGACAMLAIAILLMAVASLNVRVVTPISRITTAMNRLSTGCDDVEIPALKRDDEIGQMARALDVFRSTAEERKRLAHDIERERYVLSLTLDNMEQGIVMLSPDGEARVYNRKVLALLDIGHSEALSKAVVTAFCGSIPKKSAHAEIKLACGRFLFVSSRVLEDGGSVVTFTDVTAAKLHEAELGRATRAAEAASEAKSRFLSVVSHEMRTPLNGVIGSLELLADIKHDENAALYINTAREASEALLDQINTVLDFAKLEAGKVDLAENVFTVDGPCRSVAKILGPQAELTGNTLSIKLGADCLVPVLGDAARVRQVLLNLVGNALKFTQVGAVRLEVQRIGGTAETPQFEFSVSDTGPGIPADRLPHLFREFSMVDASYARRTEGTGLGLAISKRLIEAMGGEIGVESTVGHGSRFWFRLALRMAPDDGVEKVSEASPIVTAKGGLRILIVDDNATNRLVGRKTLEAMGHVVLEASNGAMGLDVLASEHVDCVLMDVSMPVMDGLEATRRARALTGSGATVPIIALTANALPGDRDRFLEAGMTDYLAKPLRRDVLRQLLAKYFADLRTAA